MTLLDISTLKKLLETAIEAGTKTPEPLPQFIGSETESMLKRFVETDKEIESKIIYFMETQPELKIFNYSSFNLGGFFPTISYKNLLSWLLYVATRESVDIAIEKLTAYLYLDHNPVIEMLALSGVEVEKPLQITNEITLVPFENIPSPQLKEMLDPAMLKPENLIKSGSPLIYSIDRSKPKSATAALVRNTELSPKIVISFDDKDYVPPKIDTLIYEVCECLTLIGKCTPLPIAHSYILEDWIPCSGITGFGISTPIHDVINPNAFLLSGDDVQNVITICNKFIQLKQETRDKLRVPIQRLNQARRRQSLADKAIDLGISFEALFLGDRNEKEQISFTFRLRGAWFLGKNFEERDDLIRKFQKIYDCRSTAVHTGKLDQEIKLGKQNKISASIFLDQADSLCAQAIMKVIDDGKFPDWNHLILG